MKNIDSTKVLKHKKSKRIPSKSQKRTSKQAMQTIRKKYQRVEASHKEYLVSLIKQGMSIKEASKITEIGYENAKAIKRLFLSNPHQEVGKFKLKN